MSNTLRFFLLIFSLFLFILVSAVLKKGKIPVRFATLWYIPSIITLIIALIPNDLSSFLTFFGFETLSNLIIAIFIALLFFITLILTIIISNQRKLIRLLIQETSMLKSKINNE